MLGARDVLVLLSGVFLCQTVSSEYNELSDLFNDLNQEVLNINHQTAQLAWDTTLDPGNARKFIEVEEFGDAKRTWKSMKCNELKKLSLKFNLQQRRVFNILCRGPEFTRYQQKKFYDLSNRMERIYTFTEVCVPEGFRVCQETEKLWNSTFIQLENEFYQLVFYPDGRLVDVKIENEKVKGMKCYKGEPDLEKLMAYDFSTFSSDANTCMAHKFSISSWIWEAWRMAVGPRIKQIYPELVNLMNEGVAKDGFADVAKYWNFELEIGDDVEGLMEQLMKEVQPLYNMLHAFLRSMLQRKGQLKPTRNLPAHILGWNSNWYHLFKDVVEPELFKPWNMDEVLKSAQWDTNQFMKRVEDFYTSMGLSRMTDTFWNKSLIGEISNLSCHGTAADMFSPEDFRAIICGHQTLYDFYVAIHEVGHIEQYMLAQNQPGVFRAGNSIVQETVGDAFFLAMMAPMHLNRLRLIEDDKLFPSSKNDFDLHQLMMLAFMKLPEIPFGYVFEKFRYDLFAHRVDVKESNDYFWELSRKYQRVEPPNPNINRDQMFDAAAKFHFASNVPYARYFFANILQYQVFRGMCEKTFYGRLNTNQTLPLPLHKCDIYGSKRAGNLLKKALQPGSSVSLQSTLKALTGNDEISTDAMMEFYKPLMKWLKTYLDTNKIAY